MKTFLNCLLGLFGLFHIVNCENHLMTNEPKSNISAFNNATRINDLLSVFNIREIGLKWPQIHNRLSSECESDMTEYLDGLSQEVLWALKSEFKIISLFYNCKFPNHS
jgi:hypothetical protein